MYVHNDTAAAQSLHGVTEDVTGSGLHNIFHELWPVGIEAFPFLSGTDTFIGDAFATELVNPDPGFYISQASAGRKRNKKHAASAGKG